MKLLRFLLLICMMQSLGVMAQSKKPNTNSSEANSPKIDTEILARHRRSEAHRPAEIDANAITYPAESVKQNFLRPPTSISTLIDNSPVKEKSTIESAISPENNSFGLEYILESFTLYKLNAFNCRYFKLG